jgi:hypothetical protein
MGPRFSLGTWHLGEEEDDNLSTDVARSPPRSYLAISTFTG